MSRNHISAGEAFGLAAATTLALMAGGSTAPSGGGEAAVPRDPVAAYREAIAHRFGSCAITGVEHDTSHPVRIYGNGGLRDKLVVRATVTETPEALAAAQKYEEDDTVFWEKPALVGTLVQRDGANPFRAQILAKGVDGNKAAFIYHNPTPVGTFMPQQYPEGVQAAFYAESTAKTSPEDGIHQTEGYLYCGSLIMRNGEWVQNTSAAAQPNVTVETVFPYEDQSSPVTTVTKH